MARLGTTLIYGNLDVSRDITVDGNLTVSGTTTFPSQTAATFLAAPNVSDGSPTFRSIVAADIPILNQNTTGTASNITGTVAIANGGTGQTTAANAFDALSPLTTAGDIIYHNGTNNVRLPKGTASQILKIKSDGTIPE
jgi:trimeric autotransporter adhesin